MAAAGPAAVLALAGCGSGGSAALPGDRIAGHTLTIYSSVPLHGASSATGEAVVQGEQLALAQARERVGDIRIVFRALDDSTPQRGEWDPGQTTVNARLASKDRTTIGYIGEVNSGASAVSIPLLNRLGIAQISPSSAAVGLTSGGSAASPGEPDKYYPTGIRTFVRIVPSDAVQAAAQVQLQRRDGCRKTYVLDDGEVDGLDAANSFSLAAQGAGLRVLGVESFDPTAQDYRSLATAVAQTGADCVLFSALTENHAVALTTQVAAAMPKAKLFGTAPLGEPSYTSPDDGGLPPDVASRVTLTVPVLEHSSYPPAGRAFFGAYERRYGSAEPYAIYGYEAMSLMLNAISRATDHGRKAARRSKVVQALFQTRERRSVLGTYGIDRDGDTTLRRYGVYRIVDGGLVFAGALPG